MYRNRAYSIRLSLQPLELSHWHTSKILKGQLKIILRVNMGAFAAVVETETLLVLVRLVRCQIYSSDWHHHGVPSTAYNHGVRGPKS
jgi:hypothetical protein